MSPQLNPQLNPQERAALAENAANAAALLKAMANENRLMILCTLMDRELSVGELNQMIPLSQSALSQHLGALRKAGLVVTRKESQSVFYRMEDPTVLSVISALKQRFCP